MAYNSAIDNVYNHYLTTYAPNSSVSKYDTHKKSELRGIYNSMLKLNKDAPLYLLNSAQDSREFAVNLKENARALRNTIASIGGQDDESLFKQKSAYSTMKVWFQLNSSVTFPMRRALRPSLLK